VSYSYPTGHRVTYHRARIANRVETARYRDDDGNELVIASHHANLTDITSWPVAGHGAGTGIHRATDAEGREVYIRKVQRAQSTLRWTGSGPSSTGGKRENYCPADEWCSSGDKIFDTAYDAEVPTIDSAPYQSEIAEQRAMLERADAAAAAIDGDGERAWSRRAYEAAVTAAGLTDPASDEDTLHLAGPGGGVYAIPEYHREHVVWVQLAYRRAAGVKAETVRAEETALERADQAVGRGDYSRTDYERACAAAQIDPLEDPDLLAVLDMQFNNQYGPIRDVLGGLAVTQALGGTPRAAATLAERRRSGMRKELEDQRAREREELAAAGTEFATDAQVKTIMKLLARRERSGEGGGFFSGPTDPGGVANLSTSDASAYITSLRGDY
jgi:hypothetical protein